MIEIYWHFGAFRKHENGGVSTICKSDKQRKRLTSEIPSFGTSDRLQRLRKLQGKRVCSAPDSPDAISQGLVRCRKYDTLPTSLRKMQKSVLQVTIFFRIIFLEK